MKIDLPLDGTARRLIRPVSKAVFNGTFVFEAVLAIAQTDRFYAGQLVELTGCEGSYASSLIRKFKKAGLVEAVSQEPGQARKYFRRRESPLWPLVLEWGSAILASPEADVARLPSRS